MTINENAKSHLRSALKILRRECDQCPNDRKNCTECRRHSAMVHIADAIAYTNEMLCDVESDDLSPSERGENEKQKLYKNNYYEI